MRLHTVIVIVVLSVLTNSSAAEQAKIVSHTLDNGLKVLIYEKHTIAAVGVQVWYHVGSADEPNGLKGIAHLFEHMMFRGSKNVAAEEHFRLIRAAGGQCNAYTSDEVTVYHQRVPADKLELVLWLEADRMASLRLDQKVLDTERQVVMEEYRMRVDNDPLGSIERDVRKFLFHNSPYEFGPIGKMEDIKNLTVEDCQSFYKKYYAPNNATLVIAGDVDADKAIEMVKSRFGDIPSGELLHKRAQIQVKPDLAAEINKSKTDFPVPVCIFSFYTKGARDKDRAALQILLNALTQGKSSRLWRSLVKEKRDAEYFTGEYIEAENNGLLILAAAYLPGMRGKVERNIWNQLEKIKENGLNEDEFIKARNLLRAGNVFEKYYVDRLASTIGFSEVVRGDYELFYAMDEEIQSVTQEDVIMAANRYFAKENLRKIYLEPKEPMLLAVMAGLVKMIFKTGEL